MIKKVLFVVFCCNLVNGKLRKCSENFEEPEICTLDPKYDKMKPPQNETPLPIFSSLTLNSIDRVNENGQSITFNVLFAIFWNDSRLFLKNGQGSRVIGSDMQPNLFIPRMKILKTRKVENIKLLGSGQSDITIIFGFDGRNYHDHYLEYQQNLKLTLYCPFEFQEYPFDDNYCDFDYGPASQFSDAIQMKSVLLRHNGNFKNAIGDYLKWRNSRLPFEFQMEIKKPFNHQEAGFNYSYTGIRIKLRRKERQTLLLQFYFPTLIFALTAFISYFINPDIVSFIFT